MKIRKTKEDLPGNDVLHGIERWVPEQEKPIPDKFKHQSPNGIWYKSQEDMMTCMSRA